MPLKVRRLPCVVWVLVPALGVSGTALGSASGYLPVLTLASQR